MNLQIMKNLCIPKKINMKMKELNKFQFLNHKHYGIGYCVTKKHNSLFRLD